jgi:hypothetical protein
MDRKTLESRAANYPYLQGLWPIGTGLLWIMIGISNLGTVIEQSWFPVIVIGIGALAFGGERVISKYYRENYGDVIPTKDRRRRYTIASVAWTTVCLIGLFVKIDGRICLLVTTFAAATLVFYAMVTGVRAHHWAVWAPVVVAGLLPVWGGLDDNRNAVVMIPLGVLLIVTGLLDQQVLRREFATVTMPDLADTMNVETQ